MKKITSLFFTACIFVMFSCSNVQQQETNNMPDSSTTKFMENKNDMELFSNIEMIEYCLPLPLKEYDESNNGVKAMHTFAHKTKRDNIIAVQGLMRENPSVSIEDYFANSVKGSEEEGRVIQKKELLKNNNCFYTKGYWANSINESRFIDICWMRKDEVVTFYASYDVADTTIWDQRLATLIEASSFCK